MREIIGEYKSSLKKLFDSFRKRFGLVHSETLEYVDKMIDDKNYAILYFASDITYSKELIEEINASGVGQAFGFYKSGPMAVSGLDEIKEAIPRIVGDGGNKFIFVELEERSRFRLEDVANTVFIKQGRVQGEFAVDIVKARDYVEDEVIRKVEKSDLEALNVLYNKLYRGRCESRSDIFIKNFKMSTIELSRLSNRCIDIGAYVCYKKDRLVGFIIFENVKDMDNQAFEDKFYLTVRDIYVDEEFRRQGIATRLFKEISRMADKNCLKYVRFKTWNFDEEMNGFVNSLNKKELYKMYEIEI